MINLDLERVLVDEVNLGDGNMIDVYCEPGMQLIVFFACGDHAIDLTPAEARRFAMSLLGAADVADGA